jgi:hypothetical protein
MCRASEPRSLLAYLTCRWIVAPAAAWREFAAEDRVARSFSAPRGDADWPPPILHSAAVGGVSVLLSAVAIALRPGAHFSSVLHGSLAAISGWVGAGAAAVLLAPRLISSGTQASSEGGVGSGQIAAKQAQLARYASLSSLPLAAGGITSLLPPVLSLNLAIIAVLGLLAYRSGSLGARHLLGLSGPRQVRAATLTTLVSTLPALLAALSCAAR